MIAEGALAERFSLRHLMREGPESLGVSFGVSSGVTSIGDWVQDRACRCGDRERIVTTTLIFPSRMQDGAFRCGCSKRD
jgi:hypothetical protein